MPNNGRCNFCSRLSNIPRRSKGGQPLACPTCGEILWVTKGGVLCRVAFAKMTGLSAPRPKKPRTK